MANGNFLGGLFDTPVEAGTGNQAMSGFEQLLSDPLFTGGLGLLAGALDDDVGTGDTFRLGLLGAEQGLQFSNQRQQIEANRRELQQQARQERARRELLQRATQPIEQEAGTGLLSSPLGNRGETLGLLADAFPEQLGERLADQFFPEPGEQLVDLGNGVQVPFSDLTIEARNAVAAGHGPGTQTFREAVAAASDDNLEEIAATTDILFKQAQIQQLQEERQASAEELRRAKARKKVTIANSVENTVSAIRANNTLEGTALESGAVAGDTARSVTGIFSATKKAFGRGDPALDELNTAFDRFGQLTTRGFIDEAGEFQKAIDSPLTNQKIAILRGDTAGLSQTPQANRIAFAERLELQLDTAQIEGTDVPNAGRLRATIPVLKGEVNVETMSEAELRKLDRSLLPARVRQRVEELLGGGSTTRSRGGSTTTPGGARVEFLD